MSKRNVKVRAPSIYDQQKASWENWKSTDGRDPFDWGPQSDGVGARDFIAQLRFLALVTGDSVFRDAIRAITNYDLLDSDHNWKRGLVPELLRAGWERHHDTIFGLAEISILSGQSKRSAFAQTAAVLRIPANSFDAAVKQVERLWEQRKLAGYTFEQVEDQITSDEMDVTQLRAFARVLEVLGMDSLRILEQMAAHGEQPGSPD